MAVVKYKSKDGSFKTLYNYNINNVPVVQGTGDSEDSVMSQKAVTDELAKYVEKPSTGTEYATQKWVTDQGYTKNEGTVKSVGGASAADSHLTLTGSVTDTGNLTVGVESGYSIPSNDKQTGWDNKQGAISDLDTIRSNASKGATAEGWGNHANAGYLKGTIEVVTVSSNQTNYTKTVTAGQQAHVIFANSGSSSDYTVAISTSYKTPDGQALTLTVPKGGYAEANFMNIGGTTYVRGL